MDVVSFLFEINVDVIREDIRVHGRKKRAATARYIVDR